MEEIQSTKSSNSELKAFWKRYLKHNVRQEINRSSKLSQLQIYLIKYFRAIMDGIQLNLKDINIDLDKVGYVFCMGKLLMDAFYISSRDELLELIKKNNLINFMDNPRKMIVVDQGEKTVWEMNQYHTLCPQSYYVHAHMADNHIYLKLKDVVDTTGSNGGIPEFSTIFIKDRLIPMDNIYDQVADALWDHIQSLIVTERESFIANHSNDKKLYLVYKAQLTRFIKEEVSTDHMYMKSLIFDIAIPQPTCITKQ